MSKRYKPQHAVKNNLIKYLLILAIVIFSIILIFSSYEIIMWIRDHYRNNNIIKDINNNVDIKYKDDTEEPPEENDPQNEIPEEPTSDYWQYMKMPLMEVDISNLKEKNSDTIGWINVNNTNINYPFVQADDNNYYLNHSYDKNYNEAGWVFLDYRNNSGLSDKNNIIYAHSRLDKTMFGSLSKAFRASWYTDKSNHIIRISTEEENSMWQIVSIYKIEEESYYITTDFNSDEEYDKFLNTIKGRSIYDFNTKLDTNDIILTLSTCYSDTERTVVHAKLIKKRAK